MPHIIEIDIPPECKSLVNATLAKADEHGIDVLLSKDRVVTCSDGSVANGFFDHIQTELAVACGQPVQKWMQILLHEGSHMDQWIERTPYWLECEKFCGVEAMTIVQLWLDNHIEFTPRQKWEVIKAARNVELDCERRAAKKLDTVHIDGVTVDNYTRRANSYILFYNMIGFYRKWYTPGKEPYNSPEIALAMPNVFHPDDWYEPDNMSNDLIEVIGKHTLW